MILLDRCLGAELGIFPAGPCPFRRRQEQEARPNSLGPIRAGGNEGPSDQHFFQDVL